MKSVKIFLLNIIGNQGKHNYKFSLNKQMLFLITLVAIFCPFFFIVIIWSELGADQKLDLLKSIFLYYGSSLGILVGAYSYNRARETQNDDDI